MMKQTLKSLYLVIALAGLLLSACNAPATATPTEAIDAIYTAAAQTIEAAAALATSTPKPTETPLPSQTPTATVTLTPAVNAVPSTSAMQNYCDNAVYVSDVTIPDGTVLAPGQVFEKTWALKNTGTCAWTGSYSLTYVSGDQMNGENRAINQPVASQAVANVTVRLNAPTTPGEYTGYWRMANSKGEKFGNVLSVVIVVSSGGTVTVTVTPEPSASETPTVVATTSGG